MNVLNKSGRSEQCKYPEKEFHGNHFLKEPNGKSRKENDNKNESFI